MKRYLRLLPVILFPYFIVFISVSMLELNILGALFHGDALIPLLILLVLYIVSPIWAVVVFVKNLTQKRNAKELLRVSKVVKQIQIPAHIMLFFVWLAAVIMLARVFPIFVFFAWAWVPIFSSGLLGLSGVIRGVKENRLSKKTAVLHGVLQFVFIADVVSAVVLYRKMNHFTDEIDNEAAFDEITKDSYYLSNKEDNMQ